MSNRIKPKQKKTVKDRIREAKQPERIVNVCLRGDLWAELQGLDEQLRVIEAAAADSGRFVGNPEARRLTAEIEALQAEMAESTEPFRMRALPRGEWTALKAKYPPRDGNEGDARIGCNEDDFSEALLKTVVVEPELDEEDWTALLVDKFTDQQYEELVANAWAVNKARVSVPFSEAALKVRRSGSE